MGFCLFNNVAIAARARAGRRRRARRDRRLGRPSRQRHAGRSSSATTPCCTSRCTSGRSIRAPAARTTRPRRRVNVPLRAGSRRRRSTLHAFDRVVEPAVAAVRARARARLGRLRRARGRPARRDARHRGRVPRARRRCAALAPRVAAVLEGGYNLETLPGSCGGARRIRSESRRPAEPAVDIRFATSLLVPGAMHGRCARSIGAGGRGESSPRAGDPTHPRGGSAARAGGEAPRAPRGATRRRASAGGSSRASGPCARR